MGLGKTVQTIAAILHGVETAAATRAPPPPPALIVAPASLLEAWRLEVERWAPTLTVAVYRGPKLDRDAVWGAIKPRRGGGGGGGAPVRVSLVLTSFEYASSATDAARLSACEWGWLVVDEAHRLKGGATRKLYSALSSVGDGRETRLLLTGTPLQNDSAELLSLLHFLFPTVFTDVGDWEEWFSVVETSARGVGARRGASAAAAAAAAGAAATLSEEELLLVTARLHQVLRPFILRRTKAAVAAKLPPLTTRLVSIPPSPYQAGLLALLADPSVRAAAGIHNAHAEERFIATVPSLCRLATRVPPPRSRLPPHPLPADVRLSSKLDAFDRLMAKVVAGGHKALMFLTSVQTLGALASLLDARGIQHEVLTGDTPTDERATSVARFNGDPGVTAFLLTIRAGGVGLNLQVADTVVFFDADPNPAANAQAAARAHRLTTTHEVRVVHLVTAGSVEERLAAAAAAKARTAAAVVDGGGFDGGGTSADARRELVLAVLREAAAARGGGGDRAARGASDADLNAALARSEDELGVLAAADAERDSHERAAAAALGGGDDGSRLASADDVAPLLAAVAAASVPPAPVDGSAFGRGKRRPCRGEEEEDGGVAVVAEVAAVAPPADPTPMLVEAAPASQQQEAAVPSPEPPQTEAAAVPSPPLLLPLPPRALGRMTFSQMVALYTTTFGQPPRSNNTDSIRRALKRGVPMAQRGAVVAARSGSPVPEPPADPTPEPPVLEEVAPSSPQEEVAAAVPSPAPQLVAAPSPPPLPPRALGRMTFSNLVALYTTTFGQAPRSNNTASIRRALERGAPIVSRRAATERAASPPLPPPADPMPEPEEVVLEPPQEVAAVPSPAPQPQEEAAVLSPSPPPAAAPSPPRALGRMTFSQLVSLYTTTFGQPPSSNNTASIRWALQRGTPIVSRRVVTAERAPSPLPPSLPATRAKRAAASPPSPPATRAKRSAPLPAPLESVGAKRAASAGAKRAPPSARAQTSQPTRRAPASPSPSAWGAAGGCPPGRVSRLCL